MGPNIGYLLWKGHPGLCPPRTLDCNQQTYHQNPRDLIPERGMEKFCFYEIKPSIKNTKKNSEYEN
jgi:hypothetical protein